MKSYGLIAAALFWVSGMLIGFSIGWRQHNPHNPKCNNTIDTCISRYWEGKDSKYQVWVGCENNGNPEYCAVAFYGGPYRRFCLTETASLKGGILVQREAELTDDFICASMVNP